MSPRRKTLIGLAVCAMGCVSTEVVRAPVTTPDETAYGSELHVLNAGVVVQRTIATGIVGSTPGDAGPRADGVWRIAEGGLEVEYCEGGACQRVSTGEDRSRWKGPLIMLDPVNRGNALQQTTTTTPRGEQTTTTGDVAIGSIETPFTRQRGAWIVTSTHDELLYCSAADGRAACLPAQLGTAVGKGFFSFKFPIQVLSVHVVEAGAERSDVVWVVYQFQPYRCEGGETSSTPTCTRANVQ